MFTTYGAFDAVGVQDDELHISGWMTTKGHRSIDAVRVRSGHKILAHAAELRLPSPDVMAAYPELVEADNCRFRLRARLAPGEGKRVRTSLITVTPQAHGQDGGILTHMIDSSLPPPRPEDIELVGGGFLNVACAFLSYMIDHAGLTPETSVLDVGCGFGRIAHSLVHYLKPTTRYEGFDVVARMIDWAKLNISPRHPNFGFKCVDLYNKTYNPDGKLQSADFRFPYDDNSFDVVFLTSVFTHMFGRDVRHYLDEIRRVLRPGGRCLATCFLLNQESLGLIAQGKGVQKLVHPVEDGFVVDPTYPEGSIGFPEPKYLSWITDRGMTIQGKYYGTWCGRSQLPYYQDMVVFSK